MRFISIAACLLMLTNSGAPAFAAVDNAAQTQRYSALGAKIETLMHRYNVPGGQVCVARKGQIVYSQCFGFADKEEKQKVEPDNLFRIASCSKPITAVAIWQLIEQRKLRLDDKAFDILKELTPPKDATPDPRLQSITIDQLLHHTGGFSIAGGDPMFQYIRAAADEFNQPRPASGAAIIRHRIGQPLDFDPGTKSVYSNFGFCVLGRVIEKISGMRYSDYVYQNVLQPAGATSMRLGRTRFEDRNAKEAYYSSSGRGEAWSWSELDALPVPGPYGANFAMEPMDANGGWIATAEDLVKFISAVDGHPVGDGHTLLSDTTRAEMLRTSRFRVDSRGGYRAGGVIASHHGSWWHSGALSGTSAMMVSLPGDIAVAAVFNALPRSRMNKYYPELFDLLSGRAVTKP